MEPSQNKANTDSSASPANQPNPLEHLSEDLKAQIASHVSLDAVRESAACDLDSTGMYAEGQLVLTDDRLGCFYRRDGRWDARWIGLSDVKEAKIVEGLGVHSLELLGKGDGEGDDDGLKLIEEFRFTLRNARAVAKLHRRIERQLTGKDEPAEGPPGGPGGGPPRHDGDKKVRCEKCGRAIPPWSEFCPACMSRRKVLSRLMDFVRPYKWRAGFGIGLAILATLLGLLRPLLNKPMLDQGLGLAKGFSANYGTLMFYVGLLAGIAIVTAVLEALRQRFMGTLGSRIGRDLRDKTYEHMHKLNLSFFARKPTGSLITRVTSDAERIWDFVAWTTVEVVISSLTIAGVCTALFLLNWKLACFVLIPIPLMAVMTVVFHNRMHNVFDRLWHRYSQMTSIVSDALPGVRVIKAFSQEKREINRFANKNDAYYRDEVGSIMLLTLFGPVLQFCSQIGSLIVWIVGGYWVVKGWMTPGTLMAFVGFMWMFYGPIHMLSHMDQMLNRAASSVQRIFEILDTDPVIFSHAQAHAGQAIRGEIELRDVSFSYDGIRKVLQNVSMKVVPGEMIGLAGPSGGGKTTLVNLICRFYDVLEGKILIDGVDVRDYELESLRMKVGVVLQEPFLFHGTVAENIAYGRPDAGVEAVMEAARAANAHDFIVGFPDGYDTMVGERGQTLSGGERQRISIARAILTNPSILILDEATSSVDTETEKLIQQALDRLVAGRTTIAIAHRLSTLRKASRLVILEKGKIAEEGSHDALAAKEGGVYAKMLRVQNETQSIMAISG